MISSLELAKLCGVSQGTVDRALHDRPGISAKTRDRILKVAQEHGYQANPVATEMMQGKSIIVGGLVPSLNSIFFMDLFETISRQLDAMGLRLQVCSYDSPQSCLSILTDFAARKSAGVIMVPPVNVDWNTIKPILKSLPIISLIHSPDISDVHGVHPDEVTTGKDAVKGLIKHGHRQILMVDYDSQSPAVLQRAQGYEQAMLKAGLTPMRVCKPDTQTLLKHIQASHITAVFCHNDWLALEVIRQLHSASLHVPDDVSVLGVDDSPTFITLCDQVTTMHYPAEDIAEHVTAILNGKPLKRRVKPCRWVERKSVRAI
ncbi:MAG: LacI family DNA-binding transcriptional regulator [Phycisphaeraceae bacterium JB051]